jgi:peptidoglycan/xylan/chitin deacetylase (PgdA/CDA1 family)
MIKALLKSVVERGGMYRPYDWLHRFEPVILMYHGLTVDAGHPEGTQLRVEEFERQMRHLARHHHVVPLSRLAEMLAHGDVTPRAAAVTFDDGYRSVHQLALPVLRRHRVPATVFLTSGFLSHEEGTPRFLWTDRISMLLHSAGGERLDLTRFHIGVLDLSSPAGVRRACREVTERLKGIPVAQREEVTAHLEERFGPNVDPDAFGWCRPMSWAEAGSLASDDLIDIGGHTRTHPILSQLPRERLRDEILGGRDDLRSRLGVEVDSFAYPNGRLADFDEAAVNQVRAGFRCAVTTVKGRNTPRQDPFLLRRMSIGSELPFARFKAVISGIYSR